MMGGDATATLCPGDWLSTDDKGSMVNLSLTEAQCSCFVRSPSAAKHMHHALNGNTPGLCHCRYEQHQNDTSRNIIIAQYISRDNKSSRWLQWINAAWKPLLTNPCCYHSTHHIKHTSPLYTHQALHTLQVCTETATFHWVLKSCTDK